MKINSNITAYLTNNALHTNENSFTMSTQRLSSGFKINTAGDDPTGYAISSRMRAMLDALDKCDVNATNGVSMLETAEGTMAEIGDMVQRLNELAIKAANGTLAESDRADIQKEVTQLTNEIDRMMQSSELNEQKLINGRFENTGYCTAEDDALKAVAAFITVEEYSDQTNAGTYNIKLSQTEIEPMDAVTVQDLEGNSKSIIPGYRYTITVDGFPEGGKPVELAMEFPQYVDPEKAAEVTYDSDGYVTDPDDPTKKYKNVVTGQVQGRYEAINGKGSIQIASDGSQFITVKAENDQEITIKISPSVSKKDEVTAKTRKYAQIPSEEVEGRIYDVAMDIPRLGTKINGKEFQYTLTGKGSMALQVGAREDEKINVSIKKMSLERMDLDGLDVTTRASATHAIDRIKNALSYVSDARSRIGAYQNRVERSISFIAASTENLNESYSRIMDTDMAEEMTAYANLQVLTQASTSMLAQANQMPQEALQLLQ